MTHSTLCTKMSLRQTLLKSRKQLAKEAFSCVRHRHSVSSHRGTAPVPLKHDHKDYGGSGKRKSFKTSPTELQIPALRTHSRRACLIQEGLGCAAVTNIPEIQRLSMRPISHSGSMFTTSCWEALLHHILSPEPRL